MICILELCMRDLSRHEPHFGQAGLAHCFLSDPLQVSPWARDKGGHKHTVHIVGLMSKENFLCVPSDCFH